MVSGENSKSSSSYTTSSSTAGSAGGGRFKNIDIPEPKNSSTSNQAARVRVSSGGVSIGDTLADTSGLALFGALAIRAGAAGMP